MHVYVLDQREFQSTAFFSRAVHSLACRSDNRSPKRSVKDKKAYADSPNLNIVRRTNTTRGKLARLNENLHPFCPFETIWAPLGGVLDASTFRDFAEGHLPRLCFELYCASRCTRCDQAISTLRQAFCDQSDGHARVDAVTSLLLSEGHLQTSAGVSITAITEETTVAPTAAETTTTTVQTTTDIATKAFLETREAFYLDADVSADDSEDNGEAAAPEGFASGEISSGDVSSVMNSSSSSRNGDQRVSVSTVLREMGKKDRNRRQLLIGRLQQQQKQQQHRYHHRHQIESAAGLLDNDHTRQATRDDHEGGLERLEGENGQWPSQQGGGNMEANPPIFHEEGDTSAQKLALAASVSTLSGMLVTLDEAHPVFPCGDGSEGRKGPPFSGRVGGGGVGAVVAAVRRLGLPLLMVQSTEDALIGSPLAFFLKQEVRFVRYHLNRLGRAVVLE